MEVTASYIDLIFSMATKTLAKERSSNYECRKYLLLYMIIMHNYNGLVDTYLPTMNNIVLDNMGQHGSAAIPITRI